MKTVFTTLFLLTALLASSQFVFKKRFPFLDYSELRQIIQLSDGSYVTVGTRYFDSTGAFDYRIFLVKMDAYGDVENSYLLGNTDDSLFQYGYCLAKASDGGFVVGAAVNSTANLIKFSAGMSIQWQKTYVVQDGSAINKVMQTADGGYLMAGTTMSGTGITAAKGFFLMKTDSQGENASFRKMMLHTTETRLQCITTTTDGNYAVLYSTAYGDTSYLTKVNTSGTVIWSKAIQTTSAAKFSLYPICVTSALDGGLVVCGQRAITFSSSDPITSYIPWIVKYNSNGDTLWSKNIMMTEYGKTTTRCVKQDIDGGYLLTGNIDNYDSSGDQTNSNAFASKITDDGSLVWFKTVEPRSIGATGYVYFEDIIPTIDSGYAVCGERSYDTTQGFGYTAASIVYKYNDSFVSCNPATIEQNPVISSFGITSTANSPVFEDFVIADSSVISEIPRNTTMGITACSDALPLELLSFTATLQNRSVLINWKTANEVNTDYFVVERSANRTSFDALQRIAAKGSSSLTQTYSISDFQPLQGTSYYRLKQVDKDGKVVYSSVVPVVISGDGVIVISPNPVQSVIHVVMQSAANATVTLQVIDMKGSVVAIQTKAVSTGRNEISIPAASLVKGVYVLRVIDGRSAQYVRFMKE